jgi:hypothetical protein
MIHIGWQHHCNLAALRQYKHIILTEISEEAQLKSVDLSKIDIIFSPAKPINVDEYPNHRFLFGPHFSVFPEPFWSAARHSRAAYISTSPWVKKVMCCV